MHAFLIFNQEYFQKNLNLTFLPVVATLLLSLQPSQQKSPFKIYFHHSHQQT